MRTLLSSALVLLAASSAFAADPGKPGSTMSPPPPQPAVTVPPVQSDAVKPLTQPTVVPPPAKPPGTQVAPKVTPPTGAPSVSGPKGPGVPAAGPSVPTLPTTGAPGIDPKLGSTVRDANQLDAATRDLQQLQRLYDLMHRGPGAAGNQGGLPRTLGSGSLGDAPGQQGSQGLGRDCLANPQGPGCIGGAQEDRLGRGQREGSGFGQSHDRFGAPPTLGGTLGNPGGAASGDGDSGGTANVRQRADARLGANTSVQVQHTHTDGETTVSQAGEDYEHGSRTETRTEDSNGSVEVDENFDFKDGSRTHINDRTESPETGGGTAHYHSETDANGNGGWYMEIRAADGTLIAERKGSIVAGQHVLPSRGPDSQPREDPNAGTGRNDGCNWAPLHGCLNPREDIRTTIRQQTTQPGINPEGQSTETTSGSSRGGSTGPDSVTNTGDGSFGVQRSGNSGSGTPIWQTMPDPARGGPGGPATGPGSPARRAGSDAGLDASTGALPVPPPPPR